jgi:hypothetical protein
VPIELEHEMLAAPPDASQDLAGELARLARCRAQDEGIDDAHGRHLPARERRGKGVGQDREIRQLGHAPDCIGHNPCARLSRPQVGRQPKTQPTDAPGGTDRTHGARTANLDPDDGSSEARPSFSFSGGIQTRSRDP